MGYTSKLHANRVATSILIAVVVPVLAGHLAFAKEKFPTKREVSMTIRNLGQQTSEQRYSSLARLLERLRWAESGPDGDVADFTFRKLPRVFHERKYLEILRAMDATPIDGGFAASLCVGYSRMSKEAEFREWYRTNGRSLLRCIGETWDKDDIVRLTGVPAEHFEAGR